MTLKIRIKPFGFLVYHIETATALFLDRKETRKILKYKREFPSDLTSPRVVHLKISNPCNLK